MKNTLPIIGYSSVLLPFLLVLFLLQACQEQSGDASEVQTSPVAISKKVLDSILESVDPVESALPQPEAPSVSEEVRAFLPTYPDAYTLLSYQLNPSEEFLAMVMEEAIPFSDMNNKIRFHFYRRTAAEQWHLIDSVALYEDGRKCFEVPPVVWRSLGDKDGFWAETEALRYGTANDHGA